MTAITAISSSRSAEARWRLTSLKHALLTGFATCLIASQVCTAAVTTSDNAAIYYRQAFQQLPQDDADQQLYDDLNTDFSPSVIAMIRRCEPSMKLLHQAAVARNCDWGWDYSLGLALELPEVQASRSMAKAAALRVRYLFRQKRFPQAVEATNDLMVLGNRLGKAPVIVARLMGAGVFDEAVRAASESLPTLPADALKQLAAAVDALPKLPPMGDAVRGEGDMTLTTLKKGPEAAPNQIAGNIPSDPARRERIIKGMQGLIPEAARIASLPPEQAEKDGVAYRAKVGGSDVPKSLAPPDPVRLATFGAMGQEDLALFRAAITIAQNGAAAVKTTKDPIGGGPFTYEKLPGGFQLTSRLMNKNTPVLLKTGPEALK